MNINSPRNYATLRHSTNTLDQRVEKHDLLNIQSQRDKYYQLSIKLKQENERLVIANKYLQADEDQLRKKLDQLRKKVDDQEKKNDLQLSQLKRDMEKSKVKYTPKNDKQNIHYLNNCQAQLDYIKSMLRRAEQQQEPRITQLTQSIESKETQLSNLRKQLNNLTQR